ncbi:MAG: hypothetical protein QOJ99_3245 [Bryobacterales bacterium]|nr:hypothetical protein [Bryobacterales bacterium]
MSVLEHTIGPEQKRHALEQVLQGSTFSRAEQLKRFLRYVCEMEIAGRAHEVKEYSIATEALGHSAAYSPSDGSSVRNRAHSLRQKLQEYYETENPGAEIQIVLQKGSYVPCFVRRPESIKLPEPVIAKPEKSYRKFTFVLCGVMLAILVGETAALVLVSSRKAVSSVDPILSEIWGPMLHPGAEVVICVGSPPALLLKSWRPDPPESNKDVTPAPQSVIDWYSGLHMSDGGGKLYMGNSLNTVLAGDALAAARAVRLLTSSGASVQVLPESSLRPLVLRGRNVLLIGSPNYSPYAARVLRGTPFSIYLDSVSREEVIADGRPEDGARHVFRPKRDEFGQTTLTYGLLTVILSQTGNAKNEQTVIFSGVGSAGSQAAMEFFASGPDLKDFRERVRRGGRQAMPASYQVIVRCGVDRLLALNWNYETHVIISHPPSLD